MRRFLLVSGLEAWFLIEKLEAGDGRTLGAAPVQGVLDATKRISRVSPFDERLCGTRRQLRRCLASAEATPYIMPCRVTRTRRYVNSCNQTKIFSVIRELPSHLLESSAIQ